MEIANKVKLFFGTGLFFKAYIVACAMLLSFLAYSQYTGYKWFAGSDTAFSPGGPSGVSHK